MLHRLIFIICWMVSLNFLLVGEEKSTFLGNWFCIDESDKPLFFSIKPWGEVTLTKKISGDFVVKKGLWSNSPSGIVVKILDRKNQYLHRSLKNLDILICKDQSGKDLRPWVLMDKSITTFNLREVDYLSIYREKTQVLLEDREDPSPEDNLDAVVLVNASLNDPFAHQEKRAQGLLKRLYNSSQYDGIWESVDESRGNFSVHLRTDGSFSLLESPDSAKGEWMVVNQRALLLYPSGWRQYINRSTSNSEKYYLSSFRPDQPLSDSPTIIFEVRLLDRSRNKGNPDMSQLDLVIEQSELDKKTRVEASEPSNPKLSHANEVLPEFLGVWQNSVKDGSPFGIKLFRNGRFCLLSNPSQIVGEWIVVNQRAVLLYSSGWRQFIDWSIDNPEVYYLSTFKPRGSLSDPPFRRFPIKKLASPNQ